MEDKSEIENLEQEIQALAEHNEREKVRLDGNNVKQIEKRLEIFSRNAKRQEEKQNLKAQKQEHETFISAYRDQQNQFITMTTELNELRRKQLSMSQKYSEGVSQLTRDCSAIINSIALNVEQNSYQAAESDMAEYENQFVQTVDEIGKCSLENEKVNEARDMLMNASPGITALIRTKKIRMEFLEIMKNQREIEVMECED